MTKQELIDLLNEDLKNERMHMLFYLNASIVVKGLHREEMSEFFLESAKSEMGHIVQFGNMIQGLGGIPAVESNLFQENLFDPEGLLQYALKMETEVVENYVKRAYQAEHELGGADGFWVHCFLEDQVMDSRKDADNIREMLNF